jgi:hypothetical protein
VRRPPILLLAFLLSPLAGCGPASETVESGASAPDSSPRERLVVLSAGALHLEPDTTSPGVLEVHAGTLLDLVPEDAGKAGWVRVATWDDRRGWIPASRLMEQAQWAHYGRALGVAPALVRPGYPVEGDTWGVEAPMGTPGITRASTAWLVGDSAVQTRVTAIDSLEDFCSGALHRFGILDARLGGETLPRLEEGRLVTPSGARPATLKLAIGPLEPDAELAALLESATPELAPGGAGAPAAVEWVALGEESAWASISWPAADATTGQAQLASAIVFRRGRGGWERVADLGPAASSAEIPTPAWRPVSVYAADPSGLPTILLLEALEYEGAHLDIWIERGGRYERIYEGYYWGC